MAVRSIGITIIRFFKIIQHFFLYIVSNKCDRNSRLSPIFVSRSDDGLGSSLHAVKDDQKDDGFNGSEQDERLTLALDR